MAVVALSAAVVCVYFAVTGGSQKVNLDPYQALGTVTAEETAKLLGDKGQVLVIVRGFGANQNPSVEAELQAFEQTVKKHPGLGMQVEKFQASPMLMMATGGGLPAEELFKALSSHANLNAVVMFLGFPQLADAQLADLKQSGIKAVVVSSLRPGYKQLLEQQVIHVVIVPRPEPPPAGGPTPKTVRERFDQEYLIFTPADAAGLP